jgi:maspardin
MKLPAQRSVKAGRLLWKIIATRGARGAPVLLLLPGTLGSAEIFREVFQRLAGRLRIVSVTYPMIDDIERLADSLAALLDKLGIQSASVAGSSLGGFLAQHFAALHPERVERLVLGNTLCDPGQVRSIVGGASVEQLRAAPASVHLGMVLGSLKNWPEPEPSVARLKTILRDSGSRLLGARALKARVLAVQAAPAVPRLGMADARITVLDCADDPLLPRQVQDAMRQRYPGARHVRMQIGGHYPYILRPAEYCAVLEQALDLR